MRTALPRHTKQSETKNRKRRKSTRGEEIYNDIKRKKKKQFIKIKAQTQTNNNKNPSKEKQDRKITK